MRRLSTILAVVVVLTAGSCSPSEQDLAVDADSPASEATDQLGTSVDVSLLRSDYYTLFQLVSTVQSINANQCMIDNGFEPLPIVLPPPRRDADEQTNELEGFRLDPVLVATDGYATAPISLPRPVDPREELQRSLDPEVFNSNWTDAYYGHTRTDPTEADRASGVIPPSGCYGAAGQQLLNGAVPTLLSQLRAAEDFWNDAYQRANQDETYQSALSDWSSCMNEKGFDGFTHPRDAYGTAQQRQGSGQLDLALDQAIADLDCQTRSQVIDTYTRAWETAQQEASKTTTAANLLIWHQENYDSIAAAINQLLAEAGYTEPS